MFRGGLLPACLVTKREMAGSSPPLNEEEQGDDNETRLDARMRDGFGDAIQI
jgi:hypothetical protein